MIMKAFLSDLPRIEFMGWISILFFSKNDSLLSEPRGEVSHMGFIWSRLSKKLCIHGSIFSDRDPGRKPMPLPTSTTGFDNTTL